MIYWCQDVEDPKFKIPDELANLYDFANSLDIRLSRIMACSMCKVTH
jgi:hypothetical protein